LTGPTNDYDAPRMRRNFIRYAGPKRKERRARLSGCGDDGRRVIRNLRSRTADFRAAMPDDP